MDHTLDDCRLKNSRAKQQFDALQDEIATYFKDKPYIATIGDDPLTGDQIVEAPEPPHF